MGKRTLRPYIADNADGISEAMVAASTLKEAAEKLASSVYALRTYGWHVGTEADARVALAAPDTVFYRPMDNRHDYPWAPHRWQRDYSDKSKINAHSPIRSRSI